VSTFEHVTPTSRQGSYVEPYLRGGREALRPHANPQIGAGTDTIFGFYDPVQVAAGGATLAVNMVFLGIIAALFAAGTFIFNRKRLPL